MKNKKQQYVKSDEPNLREDGTTIDGGYPRGPKWVNPHDSGWFVLKELLITVPLCIILSLIFFALLDLGLWESVYGICTGKIPIDGNGIKNLVIFALFCFVILGSLFISIYTCISYLIHAERSFSLSREIKKKWDKNLGKFIYKQ